VTLTLTRTRDELDAVLEPARTGDGRIALVPTMGALHEGHLELMREARAHASTVVVSIFVNPTQFGPGEDFERYPRMLDADLGRCATAGVDVVFAPGVAELYPDGEPQVSVDPGRLGGELEGAFRPSHFRGVLIVVAKLLGVVRPAVAIFGQKDYQQLVLIRRMALDLCLTAEIVGAATVRESDGLALSSRNRYLSGEERMAALALSGALSAGVSAAAEGGTAVLAAARAVLDRSPQVSVDYLELRDPGLQPAPDRGAARLLVAARVGTTRLIDNMHVELGPAPGLDEPRG
jgi:pantoate--beta-alanine ligase